MEQLVTPMVRKLARQKEAPKYNKTSAARKKVGKKKRGTATQEPTVEEMEHIAREFDTISGEGNSG